MSSTGHRRKRANVKTFGLRENPEIHPLDGEEARFFIRRCDSATGRRRRAAFIGRFTGRATMERDWSTLRSVMMSCSCSC